MFIATLLFDRKVSDEADAGPHRPSLIYRPCPPKSKSQDTHADFMARAVSPEAVALITDLTERISALEHAQKIRSVAGKALTRGRYRKGPKGIESLLDALGRFVGHLLMAKAQPHRTDKVFRSLKKDGFTGGPVTFTAFDGAWRGLEALGFLSHTPGKHRYHPLGFDGGPMKLPGQASIFVATEAMLSLAEQHGVLLEKIAAVWQGRSSSR